jgi:hypothetical protein
MRCLDHKWPTAGSPTEPERACGPWSTLRAVMNESSLCLTRRMKSGTVSIDLRSGFDLHHAEGREDRASERKTLEASWMRPLRRLRHTKATPRPSVLRPSVPLSVQPVEFSKPAGMCKRRDDSPSIYGRVCRDLNAIAKREISAEYARLGYCSGDGRSSCTKPAETAPPKYESTT